MVKSFYDEFNNPIEYNLSGNSVSGNYGHVYRISEDECLKSYYKLSYFNQESIFRVIRDMYLDNIYEVHKLLYDCNGGFSGYTMKYYEKYYNDALFLDMDYIIENFESIYRSMAEISKKAIIMSDTNPKNTILTRDKIIIIDIDQYILFNSTDGVYRENKKRIYYLFVDLILNDIRRYHPEIDFDNSLRKLSKIFDHNDSVSHICKKLTKYKYPIDIFNG